MANVTTPKFRVSYPNVFEAKKNDLTGKMEYSIVALFKKGENLDALKKAVTDEIEKKLGPDKSKWPKNLRSPFRDQGERKKVTDDGKEIMPDGYEEGAIFLNLKSNQRPGVVDQNVKPIMDAAEFYAGCYAHATITASYYDQKGNKGVSFWLQNIQKLGEGEPLGGRTRPEADFAPVQVESNASSMDLFN